MSSSRTITFQSGPYRGWTLALVSSEGRYAARLDAPYDPNAGLRLVGIRHSVREGEPGYGEMHLAYNEQGIARRQDVVEWLFALYNCEIVSEQIPSFDLDAILRQYVETALWSTLNDDETSGGECLDDAGFSYANVQESVLSNFRADIIRFVWQARELLDGVSASDIGHNFWLDRNGHGVGFSDRGLGERGDKLAKLARSFGEVDFGTGHLNPLPGGLISDTDARIICAWWQAPNPGFIAALQSTGAILDGIEREIAQCAKEAATESDTYLLLTALMAYVRFHGARGPQSNWARRVSWSADDEDALAARVRTALGIKQVSAE